MNLENILLELKPQGRTELVNEIVDIYRILENSGEYNLQGYFKYKTKMVRINYNLTPHQLTDITKVINDSVDKDERVLRRYMKELRGVN